MEKKVMHARKIGQIWHYNLRPPKRLSDAFDLGQIFPNFKGGFIRGTMRTQCPSEAERNVRAVLARLDELARKLDSISSRIIHFDALSETERKQLGRDIDARIAKLPTDQKALLGNSGGIWSAGKELNDSEAAAAFMEAGHGAKYELKDQIGKNYSPKKRERKESTNLNSIRDERKEASKYRSALTAAGIIEPTADAVTGLRSIMEKYCEAKGYVDTPIKKDSTRGKFAYAVRRFIEYHGDLSISELELQHLSEFAAEFKKLPSSSSPKIRSLSFREAVRTADKDALSRVSETTQKNNLSHLKRLMRYAVRNGYRKEGNPWSDFELEAPRQNFSDGQKKRPYTFTGDNVKAIVAHTSLTRDMSTIDYWGPLFGAHHGLRIEELCQLRVADAVTAENILCIKITDEGENQKVKNKNTFRTIPVHADLVEMGFSDFVERRRQAGGDFLFMEAQQHTGKLHEIAPDGEGRLAAHYRHRFKNVLKKLDIKGYRAGTHSFRNAWTDLARNSGIDSEHRRALAGRDSEAKQDGMRIDRTEDGYGHGFSIKILAASLNKLKPLD